MTPSSRLALWMHGVSVRLCDTGWYWLAAQVGGIVQGVGALLDRSGRGDRALRLGYFWLPCPACGEWMAGDEWPRGLGSSIPDPNCASGARGTAICAACTAAGVGRRAWAARCADESPELSGDGSRSSTRSHTH